jgi:hypothetical protein
MAERAPDFRYIPASSIGLSVNDNESIVTFGVERPEGGGGPYEQVGIVMSHRTLKLLGSLINLTLEHYEHVSGTEVFLDPRKIEQFKKHLSQMSGHATASEPPSEQS